MQQHRSSCVAPPTVRTIHRPLPHRAATSIAPCLCSASCIFCRCSADEISGRACQECPSSCEEMPSIIPPPTTPLWTTIYWHPDEPSMCELSVILFSVYPFASTPRLPPPHKIMAARAATVPDHYILPPFMLSDPFSALSGRCIMSPLVLDSTCTSATCFCG